MKWIVGYPCRQRAGYIDRVIELKDEIKELFFSFGNMPNGRSTLVEEGETELDKMIRQLDDLKRTKNAGIKHNLLLNAACYGKDSQSRSFFCGIGDTVDMLISKVGVSSVTTSSPLIARFIKSNFEALDVRASVNMEIGSIEGISYVEDYFDSFYIKRELNRNIRALKECKEYLDSKGKSMYLLANSGCLSNCSAHTFHDNLVAHESEISAMDNGYQFTGVCRDYVTKPGNEHAWLERTTFIRPEDVELYEGFTDAMKLATRVNESPMRVLNAYAGRKYRGSVMELLEPDHSGLIFPRYIDNALIPSEHTERMMRCDKRCYACGKCREVSKAATVVLEDYLTMKV